MSQYVSSSVIISKYTDISYTEQENETEVNAMEKFQWNKVILATLAIICFISVGFALGEDKRWLALFFLLLGFATMGYGFSLKRKNK
ncbi:DUF5325 family protein [Thalassobacillus sp. CUG 92003]|uniref:DUF5325 family protein n=1 Tax=Thalassobacillus sp. CUG 92003 TaxID=2736641 RepID=UPI0021065BFC|nr:DUF5325 family protein [Thalassobacillus sp. CUG 92003]